MIFYIKKLIIFSTNFASGGRDFVLGEVLGLLVHRGDSEYRHSHTRPDRLHSLRRALLSLPRRLQVRSQRDRHEGAREHQEEPGQCCLLGSQQSVIIYVC